MRLTVFSLVLGLILMGCAGGSNNDRSGPLLTLRGQVVFNRVPATLNGLEYLNAFETPARSVVLELVREDTVIESVVTGADGGYSFTVFRANLPDLSLRVRAHMIRDTGTEVRVVRENGDDIEWVHDGRLNDNFQDQLTVTVVIPVGWTGTAYDPNERKAGAFAILDTMYDAQNLVYSADPSTVLPDLVANWDWTESGAFWSPDTLEITIGGQEDADTQEFDAHVVAHEYGHYLTHYLAEDDSLGGAHTLGEASDETLCYSEGFANAFAGMVVGNPIMVSTFGPGQSQAWAINLENDDTSGFHAVGDLEGNTGYDQIPIAGSYNEVSVAKVFYDLYDSSDDGQDELSLGFGPVWNAMISGSNRTEAFITAMPILLDLIEDFPALEADIRKIAEMENIDVVNDYEDAGLLIGPRYNDIVINAPAVTVDSADREMMSHDNFGFYNKLYSWQYCRTDPVGTSTSYYVTVDPVGGSDPMVRTKAVSGFPFAGGTFDNGNGVVDTVILDVDAGRRVIFGVYSDPDESPYTVRVTLGPPG